MISAGKKTSSVSSDTENGIGGTAQWLLPSLDDNTHLAFYFEVENVPSQKQAQAKGFRFVQFQTSYQHHSGGTRLRVTTLCHRVADPVTRVIDYATCFDQETAAVLMARLAVHKAEEAHIFDVLRWLDGKLIGLVSNFSTYKQDDPSSLKMQPQMTMFPQFMFHLRRSHFLQTFNSSPDETVFFRLWLDRESRDNALIMIQPVLFSYDAEHEGPSPCTLDSSSVKGTNILVLDTYFDVVVHYGEVVVSWREAKYHVCQGFNVSCKKRNHPTGKPRLPPLCDPAVAAP